MNKGRMLLCLVFSFLICISLVGYASVSDSLQITGTSHGALQSGVFISDITLTGYASDVTPSDSSVASYFGTTVKSTVTLGQGSTSYVTYEIQVYNNSAFTYVFNGLKYVVDPSTYDNEGVEITLSGIEKGDTIAGGARRIFTATFAYASGATANRVLNSTVNYQFVPSEEFVPEVAVNGALDMFNEILNTSESLKDLENAMAAYGDNDRANASYIGNVPGASEADKLKLETLFTDGEGANHLHLTTANGQVSVTLLIKLENLDSDAEEEMTIYMTAEDVSDKTTFQTAEVFAAVYNKDSTGEWAQIGQLFEGKADCNKYDGGWGIFANSFNTDTWESTAVYYGIAAGANIEKLVAAIP